MTNEMIARWINAAIEYSIENHCIVYLMSKGEDMIYTYKPETRDGYKSHGYWVAAIFEDGHRVEA